MAVKLTK